MKCSGLALFLLSAALPVWQDWRSWPYATVGLDLGSDGLSAIHASCGYFWQLRSLAGSFPPCKPVSVSGSQGIEFAVLDSSWDCQLEPFIWTRQRRLQISQCRQHLDWVFEHMEPSQLPLFGWLVPYIIRAMLSPGHVFSSSSGQEQEAWEYMKERARFFRQGKRCCLARFQALVATLKVAFVFCCFRIPC